MFETYGDDEPASASPLLLVDPLTERVAVAQSGGCSVTPTGEVVCWGEDDFGLFGHHGMIIGDDEPPQVLPLDIAAIAVDSFRSTCVVQVDGALSCFGANSVLRWPPIGGEPYLDECAACSGAPICCIGDDEPITSLGPLTFAAPVVDVSIGEYAICVLLDDGTVVCWGDFYASGVLEAYGDENSPTDAPAMVLGEPAAQVATGNVHCAVLVSGLLRCWGSSRVGTLGVPGLETLAAPLDVPPLPLPGAVQEVRIGYDHACARLEDGSVWCWGDNEYGELGHPGADRLGDDEPIDALGPVDVGGAAVAISVGDHFSCALLDHGGVRCWGSAEAGRLGYGNKENVGDDETPASVGDVPL